MLQYEHSLSNVYQSCHLYYLQIVAAFEFVILLLLLLDLTLAMIWLTPRKFFTKKGKVIKVNRLIKSTSDTYYVSISLENYCLALN